MSKSFWSKNFEFGVKDPGVKILSFGPQNLINVNQKISKSSSSIIFEWDKRPRSKNFEFWTPNFEFGAPKNEQKLPE
jgi:hypothetical protein